ncbi:MAG TPA: sulfatase, partial [Methylomirabilota bacterium]|nr:sulfatase [Methylomirabilota bacterium]
MSEMRMSRRQFSLLSAGALAAPLVGRARGGSSPEARAELRTQGAGSKQGLNILFVFTDQERYFPKWPAGLALPSHERLQRTGVTFTNHYTSA